MGLFGGGKDWNIIAVMYEKKGLLKVNGNRAKGSDAEKFRDGAKRHKLTVFYAVFDQKRAFLEGGPGPGREYVAPEALEQIERKLATTKPVQQVLALLEGGKTDKAATAMDVPSGP